MKKATRTIIEAIKSGDYSIEPEENCGCAFAWKIMDDTIMDDGEGHECWIGATLIIAGEPIAEFIQYDGRRVLVPGISADDIPDDIWDAIKCAIPPEPHNHIANSRESLEEWLADLCAQGYRLYRDPQRGFANEWRIILAAPTVSAEDISDDWDVLSPADWATDYHYSGDAITDVRIFVVVLQG